MPALSAAAAWTPSLEDGSGDFAEDPTMLFSMVFEVDEALLLLVVEGLNFAHMELHAETAGSS